jgi:hypothetical protein
MQSNPLWLNLGYRRLKTMLMLNVDSNYSRRNANTVSLSFASIKEGQTEKLLRWEWDEMCFLLPNLSRYVIASEVWSRRLLQLVSRLADSSTAKTTKACSYVEQAHSHRHGVTTYRAVLSIIIRTKTSSKSIITSFVICSGYHVSI